MINSKCFLTCKLILKLIVYTVLSKVGFPRKNGNIGEAEIFKILVSALLILNQIFPRRRLRAGAGSHRHISSPITSSLSSGPLKGSDSLRGVRGYKPCDEVLWHFKNYIIIDDFSVFYSYFYFLYYVFNLIYSWHFVCSLYFFLFLTGWKNVQKNLKILYLYI